MTNQPPGARSTEAAGSDNAVSDRQQPFQTHSAPIFVANAEELIQLLANEPSPAARAMQREAETMAEQFRRWQTERPTNAARVAMIQELFELNRRARDHLASLQKRPTPPADVPNVQGFLRRLFKR
jgi:hypothetical protein